MDPVPALLDIIPDTDPDSTKSGIITLLRSIRSLDRSSQLEGTGSDGNSLDAALFVDDHLIADDRATLLARRHFPRLSTLPFFALRQISPSVCGFFESRNGQSQCQGAPSRSLGIVIIQ